MDASRIHDLKVVEQGLRNRDPNIRKEARIAGDKIRKEGFDGRLVTMRKRMIEETRKGRNDNANDIREDIQNHEKGGYGRSSFTFSFPEGFWDKK